MFGICETVLWLTRMQYHLLGTYMLEEQKASRLTRACRL